MIRRWWPIVMLGFALPACSTQDEGYNFDWERMIEQPRYQPNGESRFFADRRAMRLPPMGTLPHDAAPAAGGVRTGTIAGEPVERVPLAMTAALLRVGQERFDIYCAVCHGLMGDGDSVVGRKMSLRPPPPLHSPALRALPDGRIFQIITDGYGLMPSYAAELPIPERWAVVAYLRALQLSQFAELDSLPPVIGTRVRSELGAASAGGARAPAGPAGVSVPPAGVGAPPAGAGVPPADASVPPAGAPPSPAAAQPPAGSAGGTGG